MPTFGGIGAPASSGCTACAADAGADPRVARVRELLAAKNVLLAPMAGVTEAPFRGICKRFGAGLTYTEMVSATGLHHSPDSPTARKLLSYHPAEVPYGVQLFGADPTMMAEQAAAILARYPDTVALVDINMGCPVAKVANKGEGAGLMRTPERAAEVVAAVVAAVDVPVTVKFRKGFGPEDDTAVEFALAMEDAGVAAVAVHGRTRAQFYHGEADWDVIARVKAALTVPVIGSGDVLTAAAAKAMLDETGCDAVMAARGAQGNPWIFREARALIDHGETLPPPTWYERIEMAREHAAALVEFSGERAVVRMRKHVAWYIHGMPGASHVREKVNACRSHAELDRLLTEYRAYLEGL
ncbi:MAG: tRNA dihydrouridine synthase DusB [Coriobacteriia bacterium]|nr:tRNA dihydrouridine synthase DusB [Coriobacteriia bacterium]